MNEINAIIDYSQDDKRYHVETETLLFSASTLQEAWDEIKDECERRGMTMGDCEYRTKGPDIWEELRR